MFRRDGKHRNRINRIRGRIRNLVYVTAVETFANLKVNRQADKRMRGFDWFPKDRVLKWQISVHPPLFRSKNSRSDFSRSDISVS